MVIECAYANETGLGGGLLLLSIEKMSDEQGARYEVMGVDDPDKPPFDFASQCAGGMFNTAFRHEIQSKLFAGKTVVKVFVQELPEPMNHCCFKIKTHW